MAGVVVGRYLGGAGKNVLDETSGGAAWLDRGALRQWWVRWLLVRKRELVVSSRLLTLRGRLERQRAGEILVAGAAGEGGLKGGGYLVVSLRLGPSHGVDEVGRSFTGFGVGDGARGARVEGVQLVQLSLGRRVVVAQTPLRCRARGNAVQMGRGGLVDLRDGSQVVDKGVVGRSEALARG